MGAVDFSGYSRSGHKIMGIAMFDQETQKLSSNQYLMWEVPKSWSLEEAATVPLAFTIVSILLFYNHYHLLIVIITINLLNILVFREVL